MLHSISTRIAQAVPVMLIVAILTFFLMHLLPGDPAVIIAGDQAGPEAIEAMRRTLGLDRPLLEQLWLWLTHLAQGNFGESLVLNQPVLSAVLERLPVTLSLAAVAFAITLPVGVALGITAAYWRDSWLDSAVMGFALLGVSVPNFWIATLSVILFSVNLGWLPSAGYVPLEDGFLDWLAALLQPAAVLALFQIGFLARMTRSEMLEILDQDYVRTARAKGVSEFFTVSKHAFRNTLVSVVTVGGYIVSLLIGGSVVVEQVFALPGIGRLLVQAIMARDYPTVQGTMLLLGFAFVLINVLIDVLYTFIDPRVRYD
ncbi:ABC transporter permease [Achromobacter anxifer]|jgi:peptide/nickel transport system permease protein|uniref:Glutathione transport system permease protein GsiC n=1 Tax=Achromobacter anxifer TaxID=1287737 RepID=A0A6S7C709_9BURK|nr:ABC transporter permease [Achromobacter anxifer]MDF8361036.1 ABC transporter permease [Achromobacter anxifer]CAB3817762.1 Glutathione transport system permease protein GsiC [Achromobacter anxifer]CAB5513027.1 Glutathione transport system permease protein GsiC [Achromobacter anxifer]